jgi:hypothetical protein
LSPFDAVFNCGTSHLTRPDPVVHLTSAVHLQNAVQSTVRLSQTVPGVLAGATAC